MKEKKTHSLFIASTHQHIGKTTLSLGLFAALSQKIPNLTYMKPVGQQHIEIAKNVLVDKDVAIFKRYFSLPSSYSAMSPVLVPPGFTRSYLDGKTSSSCLTQDVEKAYQHLLKEHPFVLIEGTGHCGVGSIFDLNNAQVAKTLKAPVLLIASGGLGASFDELMLNKTLCDHYQVPIIGVILNKVLPDKYEMVKTYIQKALKRWDIPLLGCIPQDPLLSRPSFQDFEALFHTPLLSGKEHYLRHFTSIKLSTEELLSGHLFLLPSEQEELILSFLIRFWKEKTRFPENPLAIGLILTGSMYPSTRILDALEEASIPMLYTPLSSQLVIEKIHDATVKIQAEDTEKVKEAIDLVKKYIDFETMYKILNITSL